MKWCLVALIGLSIGSAARAETVADSDQAELRVVASRYVRAFESGDEKAVREQVSAQYIESVGGRKALGKRLAKIAAQKNRASTEPAILAFVRDHEQTYIELGPKDDVERATWFRVVKEGGHWKIDAPVADFEN